MTTKTKPKPPAKPTTRGKRDSAHSRAQTPAVGADGKPKNAGSARELITRTGRPSKITEDIIYAIGDLVLAGNYRQVAAAASGVSKATLKNWLAKGEELMDVELDAESEGDVVQMDAAQMLYVEFVHVIRTCEAHSETDLLAEAREGTLGWQAAMTIMERRWPTRWRRRDEIEHSGDVGARVSLTAEQAVEEMGTLVRAVEAMKATNAGPDAVQAPVEA